MHYFKSHDHAALPLYPHQRKTAPNDHPSENPKIETVFHSQNPFITEITSPLVATTPQSNCHPFPARLDALTELPPFWAQNTDPEHWAPVFTANTWALSATSGTSTWNSFDVEDTWLGPAECCDNWQRSPTTTCSFHNGSQTHCPSAEPWSLPSFDGSHDLNWGVSGTSFGTPDATTDNVYSPFQDHGSLCLATEDIIGLARMMLLRSWRWLIRKSSR